MASLADANTTSATDVAGTTDNENLRLQSMFGPVTDNIINGFINEIKKKKYKDKIMTAVIDPILSDVNTRYFPHMMVLLSLLITIIVLLILILVSNRKKST